MKRCDAVFSQKRITFHAIRRIYRGAVRAVLLCSSLRGSAGSIQLRTAYSCAVYST